MNFGVGGAATGVTIAIYRQNATKANLALSFTRVASSCPDPNRVDFRASPARMLDRTPTFFFLLDAAIKAPRLMFYSDGGA